MKYCNKILTNEGEIVEFDDDDKARVLREEIIGQFAKKGLRTILYAFKDFESEHWEDLQAENQNFVRESDREVVERGLTFVAAFGLNDEIREGVK
jgi:magnesium-transporting ATPase (P-type)